VINLVVLHGRLTRPAELRILPSGDRLLSFDLSIQRPGERAESVPVTCSEPPASCVDLDVDETVVVVGRVRRRFFRSGGATQSRTEVVAETLVRARHAKRAKIALASAVNQLQAAQSAIGRPATAKPDEG
jgi:single-strand DNA-binding protein